MVWKCICCCNLPKSVFPTLCRSVPLEAKLSDRQREYSNSLIFAFYPILLSKNYNNQLSHDIVNRPEYRIQEMQVELKDLEIKNTRADFLPTVGISAGYQYMGGMKLAGSSLDMKIPMVMASISIPIFNFGEGRKK